MTANSVMSPLTLCRYEPPANKDAPRNPALYGIRDIPDTDPSLGAPVLTAKNLVMLDHHGGMLPSVPAPGEAPNPRGPPARGMKPPMWTQEPNINSNPLLYSTTLLGANEEPGGSPLVVGGPQDGMPMPPPWVPGQPLLLPAQMLPPGGSLPPGAVGRRPTLTKRMIQEMHKLRQQDELMMAAIFDPLPLSPPSPPRQENKSIQNMLKRPKELLDKCMHRRYDAWRRALAGDGEVPT